MAKRQNSEKKYVIVAFQDDCDEKTGASMEVIPTCWLCGSDEAWWPSNIGSMKRIGELIRKCAQPIESLWEKLQVRVLGYSGECMHMCHVVVSNSDRLLA